MSTQNRRQPKPPFPPQPIGLPGEEHTMDPLASATDSSYIAGEVLTLLGGDPTAA